jgi:hypothetical protein
MSSTYWIEEDRNRIVIRGSSIPINDLLALSKVWAKRGIDAMVPGVAFALKASMALCASSDVDVWVAETRVRALERAGGDPLLAWFYGPDIGTSSLTIFHVLTGFKHLTNGDFRADVPLDPADFGRCLTLLSIVPEWRSRLAEVAARYPAWLRVVEAWDKWEALYHEEHASGKCPKLYAAMHGS